MTTQKMNAMVAYRYGSPGVLQLKEVDQPKIQHDEVLVKVITSAATKADAMMRSGKPYYARLFLGLTKPKSAIPGTCFAGYVEATGNSVSSFLKGDKVFGLTTLGFGANADYLVIKQSGVIEKMPDNMSFAEAATFGDGHLTSFHFLKNVAKIKVGQSVLINGASGSLGTSAIQLAKYFGAEVTAVASSRNEGLVKSLGADYFIDYTQTDFTQSKTRFDVVFDTVGKSGYTQCKPILMPNGLYLSPVINMGLLIQTAYTKSFSSTKAVFEATGLNSDEKLREMMNELIQIHQSGKLKTAIDRQYPLSRLAEAHRYIDGGHKKGNIIIVNQ